MIGGNFMEYVKMHIKIESDTIKIPELKNFIGEKVEIIILKDIQNKERSKLKMPGGLENYKNVNLISKEKKAWQKAVSDNYEIS